jgi:hypothetical protein
MSVFYQNKETSEEVSFIVLMLGANDGDIANEFALPFAYSGKSKLFQNFAALHDPTTITS